MVRAKSMEVGAHRLPGELVLPDDALGLVVFAHGSGSSRLSPRNRWVADELRQQGLGTLLFDLLSEAEAQDRRHVFDIALLAGRVIEAIDALALRPESAAVPLGLFGASTGAAAALWAAAERPQRVAAVVSRGGRPDLAESQLARVRAPTLLIVGGQDHEVLALNRQALRQLRCEARLEVVAGATHLFEEPGTLHAAARCAADWFVTHLSAQEAS
jgi:putative phosphoribosyl transferase